MNINDFCTAIENVFISKKDYVQNFDKWKPGSNNILYITGLSGSGKSTLAEEYEKKYHAHMFELDGLQHNYDSSGKGILEKCKHDIPEYANAINTFLKEKNDGEFTHAEFNIVKKAALHVIELCKRDSDTLYIIEGIQLFQWFKKEQFRSKPLVIKGTSMIKSSIRGAKRDFLKNDGSVDKKGFVSSLPNRIKWETEDEIRLHKFKKSLPTFESALTNTNKITNKIVKSTKHYYIKDNDGNVISKADYYDFSKKDFDWILICNVETKSEFRGKGLATKIMNTLCADLLHKYPSKGLYLLVKTDNLNAISLYKKINFKVAKECKIKGDKYYVMYKGGANKQQLIDMNFK